MKKLKTIEKVKRTVCSMHYYSMISMSVGISITEPIMVVKDDQRGKKGTFLLCLFNPLPIILRLIKKKGPIYTLYLLTLLSLFFHRLCFYSTFQ